MQMNQLFASLQISSDVVGHCIRVVGHYIGAGDFHAIMALCSFVSEYCDKYKKKMRMKTIVWLLCLSWLFTGCGATVKAVPSKKRVVVVEQYRHRHPKKKVVVVVGSRVKKRPPKSVVIYYRDIPYLYADGVYYKAVDDVYEVVRPQLGMIVPELPEGEVQKVNLDNRTLYLFDGVFYKKVSTSRGIQFEVYGFVDK